MTARVRLVDYLAAELGRSGVTHMFGVGGANIEDLYEAVHGATEPLRGIVAKHEFSAATMADGYARATTRLGVVAATSGGGAMNLVPGLAEAYASRVPVLALVGEPPTALAGRGAFQDSSGQSGSFDALELFGTVSRFCARVVEPDSIVPLLARAVAVARADPKGPVVLLLPKDVQQAFVTVPGPHLAAHTSPPALPEAAALDRAAAVLRGADRVLLIAGEGVAAAGAQAELSEVARRLGAWVAVTPDAKDVYDNCDPRFVGVAGVMGHPSVEDCLRRAEACVLVGTRLPAMARGGLDRALADTPLICVDPEPPFVPGIALRGSVRETLRALTCRLEPAARACPPRRDPTRLPLPRPPAHSGSTSQVDAFAAIAAALPPDAHVFVDAGNTGAGAIHLLPAPRHGRFVVAVGMGGMGYTFGAGIGAALATGRRTYVLAGDGAFFMHGMEVHTAVEYAVPVTFVILNNNAHGMCVTREHLFQGGAREDNVFLPSDIAAGVAAMFPTLDVAHARNAAQLRQELLRSNTGGRPAFIAVDVDRREIPPFLPFLATPGRKPNDTEETADERGPVHVG